jgi:palmitoyl-protein thioesterase
MVRIATATLIAAVLVVAAAGAGGRGVAAPTKYKPVVLVHGFSGSAHDWDTFVALLAQEHPGQQAFALDVDNKWASLKPMHKQVADTLAALHSTIAANRTLFADGFHLVGHSQGGLIARAVLQTEPFNVSSFVSLAGIQTGLYVPHMFGGVFFVIHTLTFLPCSRTLCQ